MADRATRRAAAANVHERNSLSRIARLNGVPVEDIACAVNQPLSGIRYPRVDRPSRRGLKPETLAPTSLTTRLSSRLFPRLRSARLRVHRSVATDLCTVSAALRPAYDVVLRDQFAAGVDDVLSLEQSLPVSTIGPASSCKSLNGGGCRPSRVGAVCVPDSRITSGR